jgi:TRAP-type C4-dicarboxylate transport system permease small subunit
MKAFLKSITVFEDVCLAASVLVSAAISILGVFFRYIVASSLSWVEETAGFLLLVAVTAGIGAAVRRGSHLRVDLILQFWPASRRALSIWADLVALGVMSVLLCLAYDFALSLLASDRRATSLYWLPVGLPLLIMPLGYLTALVRIAEHLVELVKTPSAAPAPPRRPTEDNDGTAA